MGKRVFMFPGQGSQYIGMGKEFYDTMPNAKAVIDLASEQTGLDIPALCFEENDKLNITEYTQICMLAVEAAIYQAIIDKGITPDVTAGLSLGEYGQIVITGEKAAVDAAAAACSEAGAKRCVPLKVSGPFHSAMLKGAGEKLADALESVEIHDIKVPYITNVTADYVKSPADVKDYLTQQVSSSVRWQQTIERLIADGADEFVEIGPGRSLSGFMRKINRDVKVVNIDKLEDFEKYVNR